MTDDKLSTSAETTEFASSGSDHPDRIGPYKILQKIGEGGMGEVFLAEQESPVRRRVGLKVIKRGMDTDQVVARFEAERQALATLNHPNIAKVFDAGATERGRPYFAMEYIEGVPVTEFCDRHRLTTRERLDLFIQICDGVQHAHRNAIIHRDIKPSNVLVMTQDNNRIPKIIDFGVAKATSQRLTERTVFTELGQLIGTPEYMSPEQAEMSGEAVDTRTDVYSLGVLLYELLTGVLPFDGKELRRAGFDELRRKIREDQPSKPSTRISTLGAASVAVAERRCANLPALRRQLQQDLDWITLRALEKDRTRRYGSAADLQADIRRHLASEPVLASPPSVSYRLGRFSRRHKAGVGIAIGVFALLLGFGVTVGTLYVRAERAEVATAKEARTAQEALDFVTGLFEISDPSEARGSSITAREILDRGMETFDRELADQPEVRARLMGTLGNVYVNLGLFDQARPLLKETVGILRELVGDDHPETLAAMNRLSRLYWNEGSYEEARHLVETSLEAQRRVLGPEHPETLRSANGLAVLLEGQGHLDDAESLYVETLEIRRRVLGEEHPDTLDSMSNLAVLHTSLGRQAESTSLHLETLEMRRRVLGDDHPSTLDSMGLLAACYTRQGRHAEAELLATKSLAIRRHVLGDDHPDTLHSMTNLAAAYSIQGRHAEAEPLFLRTLEARRRVLGEDHPDALFTMNNLANFYTEQERYDEARVLIEQLMAKSTEPAYAHSMGELLLASGQLAEAARFLREAIEGYEGRGGDEFLGLALYQLAGLSARNGNRDEALALLRRAADSGSVDGGIADDSNFDSLRGDAAFEAIVTETLKRPDDHLP